MILHGIDFSGASSGGAAKIRVVERDLLKRHDPIRSKGRMDRNSLVRHILECAKDGQPHMFRIDAPIGLALESLRQFDVAPTWSGMVTWMESFKDPRLWRTAIRKVSRQEPKRICDQIFRTPMAPMNLRIFKQTWTLIAEVLKPLADAGIRIEPVHNEPIRVDLSSTAYTPTLQHVRSLQLIAQLEGHLRTQISVLSQANQQVAHKNSNSPQHQMALDHSSQAIVYCLDTSSRIARFRLATDLLRSGSKAPPRHHLPHHKPNSEN